MRPKSYHDLVNPQSLAGKKLGVPKMYIGEASFPPVYREEPFDMVQFLAYTWDDFLRENNDVTGSGITTLADVAPETIFPPPTRLPAGPLRGQRPLGPTRRPGRPRKAERRENKGRRAGVGAYI